MSSRIGVLRIFPGITQEAVSIKILNLCFMFLIFFLQYLQDLQVTMQQYLQY